MTTLPEHIEAYLEEAGFTGTEILILKKLLESNAMTLRELASRTGKSTGVLDQASKKLLRKGIVTKESINNSPRLTLGSLDAVVEWVQKDMRQKKETLKRKHEDFESFIATLKIDKERPDMEHFEGSEGIQRAYLKMLDLGSEIVRYVPLAQKEEEDPLYEFRLQLFRRRRTRKIFERVIAHDTVLGRRFQSRDPYEYRETVLVDVDKLPLTCEQAIVGNTYAYFDHEQQKACFIHFPELARTERNKFDALWTESKNSTDKPTKEVPHTSLPEISLQTKTYSALREFLLSRKSIAAFGICAFFAATITYGLYRHNVYLNAQRLRERAVAIASTSALQFHSDNVDQLKSSEDVKKPAYTTVVNKLQDIREKNKDVINTYLLRPTANTNLFEFVADSYGLEIEDNIDFDGDGILSEADEIPLPGMPYDISEMDALQKGLYLEPVANTNSYKDQWGTFMTGYAPIFRANGELAAIMSVDIEASHIQDLTQESFKFFYWFISLFFVFVFIRFHAMNRSLLGDLRKVIFTRKTFLVFGMCMVLSFVVTAGLYWHNIQLNTERVREQVLSIASTGAAYFDADDVNEISKPADIYKPEWEKIVGMLNEIRNQNIGVRYAYILRKTEDPNTMEFVADADSLDPYAIVDLNKDGIIDDADALNPPGDPHDVSYIPSITEGFEAPTADVKPYTDQWGTFISGYAPIVNESGASIAVLGIDREAADVYAITHEHFKPFYYFFVFFFLFIFAQINSLNAPVYAYVFKILRSKQFLIACSIIAFLATSITFGVYLYTVSLMKEQVGQRLLSIVSTAAPEIDAADLSKIHWARDMRTEEYQRVFKKLNEIRDNNNNIEFVYILRKPKKDMYEFVVDADSNYFLPLPNDPDPIDVVPPGTMYDISFFAKEVNKLILEKPVVDLALIPDEWGIHLTATAPIFNVKGESVAFLGIDMDINDFYKVIKSKYNSFLWLFGSTSLLFVFAVLIKLMFEK